MKKFISYAALSLLVLATVAHSDQGRSLLTNQPEEQTIDASPQLDGGEMQAPALQPQPPVARPAPAPGVPTAKPEPIVLPAPQCNTSHAAIKYSIYELIRCGEKIDNSGLRGVLNRHRRCTNERLYAQVYTSCDTCEDCESRNTVRDLRENRRACNSCSPACTDEAIRGLADDSRAVRRAAVRNLRRCGYRVETGTACVSEQVPFWIYSQQG